MKSLLTTLFLLCTSASADFAWAESHPVDKCDQIEVTRKSNECWREKYQPWERTLRKTVMLAERLISNDGARDTVQDSRLKYLHDAQAAWEAYVSIQCGDVIEFEHGGTGAPSAMYQCHIAKAKSRIGELKSTYGFNRSQ